MEMVSKKIPVIGKDLLPFIEQVVNKERLKKCVLIIYFGSKNWIEQLRPVLDYAERGNFR